MAKITSIQNCVLIENKNNAAAVVVTLTAVTKPVPNFFVNLSLKRLETTVPRHIIIDIIPAYDSGASKSIRITGHAEPSNESGKPKLIKLR